MAWIDSSISYEKCVLIKNASERRNKKIKDFKHFKHFSLFIKQCYHIVWSVD